MTVTSVSLPAVSPAVTSTVHIVHGAIVAIGVVIVLLVLSPLNVRRRRRALAHLRDAAATGNLVRLAELRAAEAAAHRPSGRPRLVVIVAAVGSLVPAGVHAAVCPEHFHEAVRYGVFFVVVSIAQTAWAVRVVRRPTPRMFGIGLAANSGMVALWTLTRTVGLPFGLAQVEKVGTVDLLATIAELVTVSACVVGAELAVHLPLRAPAEGSV
jgi:hypothetical protein